MEIAKFVITCILAALTVGGAFAGVWAGYRKKVEKQINDAFIKSDLIKEEFENSVKTLQKSSDKNFEELRGEIRGMQKIINEDFQRRLSNIEGEMKSNNNILRSIQQWFITNTPSK